MTLANPLGSTGPAIDQTSLCYLQHAEGEGVVRRGSDIFLRGDMGASFVF